MFHHFSKQKSHPFSGMASDISFRESIGYTIPAAFATVIAITLIMTEMIIIRFIGFFIRSKCSQNLIRIAFL
jgi:hypothetical protein